MLASTAPVMEQNPHVSLSEDAATAFAVRHAGVSLPEHEEEAFHCAFLPPGRFLNFLLALEALNFSFWDEEPRWRVKWQGGSHDGYWALAAALHRAVTRDAVPVWDAAWLAGVEQEELAQVLAGEGRPAPMLAERTGNLNEAGRVLLARYDGQMRNLIEQARFDAVAVTQALAEEFASFNDAALWQGKTVRFFKRAQIFCADLSRLYPRLPGGPLQGLNELTAFADYKEPQVLRKEGVLVYEPELARRLDAGEPLEAGSPEEVSIRAGTIWACEWLARALEAQQGGERSLNAADVDYLLWSAGQDKTGLKPYHLTRTLYY